MKIKDIKKMTKDQLLRDLEKYITNKYSDPNGIHHYKIAQTSGVTTKFLKVESSVVGSTAVTNYQYEEDLNDAKKQIRVLNAQYVLQFESELKKELGK